MSRLSIARSLRLALTGLTVILAAVVALGVAALLGARQHYDDVLARSSQLAAVSAELATAQVAAQEVHRDVHGPGAAAARGQAELAVAAEAARAARLARGDAPSQRLVADQVAQSTAAGAVQAATALQRRQLTRQRRADASTRSDSRRDVVLMAVAGVFALLAALALIGSLIRSMRGPLDALVEATGRLAAGDLAQRVTPAGPAELRDLGASFNSMADELALATSRIEQERARLATTIASLGDAILVTEPGSTHIATINPRAEVLVPELPPGRATDGPESPLPPFAECLRAEQTIEHGGRTLAVTAAPLENAAPEPGGAAAGAGVVWTVRDISERARLERAKSDFVATASHELRSPLTSIKGFVELLATAPGAMSARQQEFVDIILRSTDRLVELVNDLLDVARLEADHVEINRRAVDAGQALREVVELFGPRVDEKRQRLELKLAPALPPVMADPGRLRQIAANLVTNAHLYTPEGGRIEVRAEPDGAWVRISVSDTGIGMSRDELEHVFDRFFRAADGRGSPGTGLGLSIVRSLVELHDGQIGVRSKPGVGTTFAVRIPSAVGALGLAPSLEALRERRVLVVDDEPEVAQLIADQLAPFEVDCTIAASGQEALDLLAGGRFDAITLDVKMPQLNGFEVLRRIRQDPALGSIPVVFVSVFADHQALAGEWVVSKPIDAEELRDALGAAVSAGRSRVLVVGRPELEPRLAGALVDLRVEYDWEASGAAAARRCSERRYEVALVDAGLRSPQAVIQALNLRGRRLRRAVILFSDGTTPPLAGIERLGLEVVPIEDAPAALASALEAGREPDAGATTGSLNDDPSL